MNKYLYELWLISSEIPSWLRLLWRMGFSEKELAELERFDDYFMKKTKKEKYMHDEWLKKNLPKNDSDAKTSFPEYQGVIKIQSKHLTDFKEKIDIAKKIDIVEIIGTYVELKKSGDRYIGLCPFHNEKTPSLTVFVNGNNYHCFGCSAHGSTINFLMDFEGLTFRQTVEVLFTYKLNN